MPTPEAPTEELASFDPPVAEAVAAVLLQAGVPAVLGEAPGGERTVLVPRARRDEALTELASRMDEVQALTAADVRVAGSTTTGWQDGGGGGDLADEPGDDRPLVLDRFRSLGWVAVALVPLLIIGLANVRLPASVVVALVIGTVVVLSAWQGGRFGGDGDRTGERG